MTIFKEQYINEVSKIYTNEEDIDFIWPQIIYCFIKPLKNKHC
ncbi:hypothetical protein SAMN05444380_12040 [Thermophagus xiamenensis]|uniref:Uncharacterized protein n=1 Tax=Thermophagus xiamenensis TaxID=385682 RepID=A0A1I2DW10_9BACT|nr:hypothetical protein SAMN05444380_12040 [Thermophagus xiamenensis]